MDIASAAGIGLAFAAVLISMVMEGGNPAALVSHPAPIILVLFGGAKLPQLARSLGSAQREFKKGLNGEDDKAIG